MKRFSFFLLLALASAPAPLFAQETPEQPVSRLSRDSVLIGDQVRWSAKIHLEAGEEAYFERPDEPVAPGLETIRGFAVDTLLHRGGRMDVEGSMILTAFDEGSYFLPPLMALIQHADGKVDTLFFDGPVLDVATVAIDTASFEPFDIKGQIRYPLTFGEVFPWALGTLALAALLFFGIRYLRYRRENRDFFGRPIVSDPPHVVALRRLDKIRGQKLWQNNRQKQFYTEVTDALRQYMAARYGIAALEQTTAEIFDALRDKEIDSRLYAEVKSLFELADFVKFAKHTASEGENEEAIPTAVRFVNMTFLQQLEKERAEREAAMREDD